LRRGGHEGATLTATFTAAVATLLVPLLGRINACRDCAGRRSGQLGHFGAKAGHGLGVFNLGTDCLGLTITITVALFAPATAAAPVAEFDFRLWLSCHAQAGHGQGNVDFALELGLAHILVDLLVEIIEHAQVTIVHVEDSRITQHQVAGIFEDDALVVPLLELVNVFTELAVQVAEHKGVNLDNQRLHALF